MHTPKLGRGCMVAAAPRIIDGMHTRIYGACAGLALALAACTTTNTPDASTTDVATDAVASDVATNDVATNDAGGDAAAFRVALSVSPFTGTLVTAGARWSDGTLSAATPTELQRLYAAHGSNEVFVRVATEQAPPAEAMDHSVTTALSVAQLARTMDLPLNPELGLWADYGDITCQPPPDFTGYPGITVPGAWNTLTVDQMVPVLRAYGVAMAHAFLDTGTRVRIWDLGNEVDFGTAGVAPRGTCATWVAPDGVDPAIGAQSVAGLIAMTVPARIAWLTAHVWPHEARLFAAVADGIRSVDPGARFATHVSGVAAGNAMFSQAFYAAMQAGGFLPDELGFSYYPSSDATPNRVAAFQATVAAVHAQFARPVFVAEFAYPAGPMTGAYATWNHALPSYPVSAAGQAALLHDLAAWGVTAGLSGVRYWAPDVFLAAWSGFALFDAPSGTAPAMARPGLSSLASGVAAPNAGALHD